MEKLKENKGHLFGAIVGMVLAYGLSDYLLSDIKPTGAIYKIGYAMIVYVLLQGSIFIGERYIDKKK